MRYLQSLSDPCVFYLSRAGHISILAVVVDDILHAASTKQLISDFSSAMENTYHIKHMGAPKHMIGLRVTRTDAYIKLDQSYYISDVVHKFKQTDCSPTNSPASISGCLGAATEGGSELLDLDVFPYMSLMGSLLWVTLTRPDIATVVSRACSHGSAPTKAHWRAALRILRYLKTTINLGLTYQRQERPL